MKMISTEIGRCLTQYKRADYEQVVLKYSEFVKIAQDVTTKPTHISNVNFAMNYAQKLVEPLCNHGELLFGIEQNGDLTLLMSVIDSTD